MRKIVLSGASWTTEHDSCQAFLVAIEAPDWHGHNLDDVWDSIAGGGVNNVNPPLRLPLPGTGKMAPGYRALVTDFVSMIGEARHEGFAVEVVCQ